MQTLKILILYKFFTIPEDTLITNQKAIRHICSKLELKGSIYISSEGINAHISGIKESCEQAAKLISIQLNQEFDNCRAYPVTEIPYSKLVVRVRQETVTVGKTYPNLKPYPRIDPKELNDLYEQGASFNILDTRNNHEISFGTFKNSISPNINNFRDFPEAIQQLNISKEEPLVIFCTGGIRCEKAAPILEKHNFKNVVQLNGGILNYFKHEPKFYEGSCFVFDDRVAVKNDFSVVEGAAK